MRRALSRAAVAALAAAASCSPEIGAGTYFCGQDMFCPPELACDPSTYTCEAAGSFGPFACPDGSEAREPDDAASEAPTLGALACNYTADPSTGCIPGDADEDLLAFDFPATCQGDDPHLEIDLAFPVATAPLTLEVLDAQGEVIAVGEVCTPEQNFTGMQRLCIRDLDPAAGTYYLRVRLGDGADCDGACRFNQYLLFIRYPVA